MENVGVTPLFYSSPQSLSASPVLPHSRRTPSWARRHISDDGYFSDSVLGRTSSAFKKKGQRIFVFIVGGATISEVLACHKLTEKLDREVILGSSSFLNPHTFLTVRNLCSLWIFVHLKALFFCLWCKN
uniref:Uncharacterized protein n=1 Tax=Brassica campestris TaxID=3711 RepID=M4FCJ3_BRACM